MREMILIPGGTAEIGAPERHLDQIARQQHYGRSWFEDETPQFKLELVSFYIDRAPVTNRQYAEFVDATGYLTAAEQRGFGLVYGADYWFEQQGRCWRTPASGIDAVADRANHPVVHVDQADAAAYARWAGKRLPTEQEWEYAAHGPRWSAWPWGMDWNRRLANTAEYWAGSLHDLAEWKTWWAHRYTIDGPNPATTPIGSFSPVGDSPWGVTDMAGNVAEWTASTYTPHDTNRSYDPSFEAAMRYNYGVVRGGSWKHFKFQTRTTERIACLPYYSAFDLGFRCVANLPTTKEAL
jgi:sulfatase modifying factor 1